MKAFKFLFAVSLFVPSASAFAETEGLSEGSCHDLFQPVRFSASRHYRRELMHSMFLRDPRVRRQNQHSNGGAGGSVSVTAPPAPQSAREKKPAPVQVVVPPAAVAPVRQDIPDFLKRYTKQNQFMLVPMAPPYYVLNLGAFDTRVMPHTIELLRNTVEEVERYRSPAVMQPGDVVRWVDHAISDTKSDRVNLSAQLVPTVRKMMYRAIDFESFTAAMKQNFSGTPFWQVAFNQMRQHAILMTRKDIIASVMDGHRQIDDIVLDYRRQLTALKKDSDATEYITDDSVLKIDRSKIDPLLTIVDPKISAIKSSSIPDDLLTPVEIDDPLTRHVIKALMTPRTAAITMGNTRFVERMKKLGYTEDWLNEALDSWLVHY